MTKEEISEYIESKQIPLTIVWENGREHYICIHNGEYGTFGKNDYVYPKFRDNREYNFFKCVMCFNQGEPFSSEKETFEECLSEFLYWWELNKHRCKSITYYND